MQLSIRHILVFCICFLLAGINQLSAGGLDSSLWRKKYAGRSFEEKTDSSGKSIQPFEFRNRPRKKRSGTRPVVLIFIVTTILAATVVLVIYLIRRSRKNDFRQYSEAASVTGIHQDDENGISDRDYNTLLVQGAYREAFRILYMNTLHMLAERGLVRLRKEKTNADYIAELGQHPAGEYFLKLSFSFSQVWYGNREIGKDEFNGFSELYDSIRKTLYGK